MSPSHLLALAAVVPSGAPPGWLILPFVLLLALIAVMPLTPSRVKHVWDHYYPHVAIGLGALVVVFYAAALPGGTLTTLHTAHEYFSFISLIGSLFV
ncbi:MAG TPA: sodium:proton antiporter, partial [Opitutaceae bacterium]